MATIQKRGNSYKITVSCGYDLQGKQIRNHMTWTPDPGMTERQIEKELQRQAVYFEDEVERGITVDSKQNLASFIESWFSDYADINLEPKTIFEYRKLLERINPALGHIRMDRITPSHLLKFYNNLGEVGLRKDCRYIARPALAELLKQRKITRKKLAEAAGIGVRTAESILKGSATIKAEAVCEALDVNIKDMFEIKDNDEPLSNNTIRHYHSFLSSVLSTAVEWQVIKENPAMRVKPPKVDTKEAEHYDEDMTEKVLILLENEPIKYQAMISLTIFAGLRQGELCGLEWSDVNFENSVLRVRQASQYLPTKGIFTKDTKNDSSYRVIALPSIALSILRSYKTWQNEEKLQCGDQWSREWDEYPRLFTQWNGKPIHPSTITQWFTKFRSKYDLPPLTFHGLRHTNATILIGQNTDIRTVSNRLGHARTSTTMNIYSHALKRPDQEAAEKLDNLFNKDNKSKKSRAPK
ncbi:MAG TPA: site-specific integrase [Clostridiales bacterium]|nr:site-specific integrase [Clostridiales bacterium]